MRKDRFSALIIALALITTLTTPIMAADASTISPTSGLDRVVAFLDGLVKKVQDAVCFVGCGPENVVTAKASQASQSMTPTFSSDEAQPEPPAGVAAVGEVFGLR